MREIHADLITEMVARLRIEAAHDLLRRYDRSRSDTREERGRTRERGRTSKAVPEGNARSSYSDHCWLRSAGRRVMW